MDNAPFDLERTVRSHGWWEIPPFSWDAERKRLSIGFRPAGRRAAPWTAHVVQAAGSSAPAVDVELVSRARGEPPGLRETAAGLLRRSLGLDADLGEFHQLCLGYEPLQWVPRSGAGRLLRGLSVADDVVASICGTNIQWKQAVQCIRRIGALAPEAPEGAQCFPDAAEILAGGETYLRDTARVGYRAGSILQFCGQVRSGGHDLELPLRRGPGTPDGSELRRYFRALPGIGPVTARYLATLYGRADEISVDSLVLRYIGDKYHGGKKPTEQQVLRRYARFGQLQALAYWFEFLGDVDPRTWRGWSQA